VNSNQRQTREMSYSNTYPQESQPKPRHIAAFPRQRSCRSQKRNPHNLQASHPEKHTRCCARHPRSPDMCFAAERCRLRRTSLQHAATPTSRIGQPVCLSRHVYEVCEWQAWLWLATHGTLEESRRASRRSLLVFRRGVRDAASENARPGFSRWRAVSRSVVQACRKHDTPRPRQSCYSSIAYERVKKLEACSRRQQDRRGCDRPALHNKGTYTSERFCFCLVLSEKAEA